MHYSKFNFYDKAIGKYIGIRIFLSNEKDRRSEGRFHKWWCAVQKL